MSGAPILLRKYWFDISGNTTFDRSWAIFSFQNQWFIKKLSRNHVFHKSVIQDRVVASQLISRLQFDNTSLGLDEVSYLLFLSVAIL